MQMRVMTAMAMAMAMAVTACGSPVEDECESGETRCTGDVVELCNVDAEVNIGRYIWTEFRDCSENVDSGTTACVIFDGTAGCDTPPVEG